MRERRESLSFLSFLPRRERPLLAGKTNKGEKNRCGYAEKANRQ